MPPYSTTLIDEAEKYYRAPINVGQVPESLSHLEIEDTVAVFALESLDKIRFHEDLDKTQGVSARLHMIDAVGSYIDDKEAGMNASELKQHQQSVFYDIQKFLQDPPLDSRGEPQSKGFIKLPTSTGKTALFSTLANVFNTKNSELGQTLKGVVLVPRLDLIAQTMGENEDRGFARFGPDTELSEYHGTKKDLNGDTVIMTYQSMIHAVKNGAIDENTFDYFICDEAHRAIGEVTLDALKQITKNKVVIGLTATPDYAENKKVEDFFEHCIHNMDFHEAIEQSLLAPIQAHLIASEEKISKLKVGEFSEAELADLIDDEWSNQKAVEFAKAYLESGRKGIISCIPGMNTRHAKEMALKLSQEFITDPKTKELRRIRAVAMSGNSRNRESVYKSFEHGDIDVLTYVNLLTEGWDSKQAKFLINLRPTASPVTAIQRLGRVLRQNDAGQSAVVLEVLRKSPKPQYTFWEALGEETFDYRKTWPSGTSESTLPENLFDASKALPKELIDALKSVQHRTIRELVIDPSQPMELPEGYTNIENLAKMLDISPMTVRAVLQTKALEGEEYQVFLGQSGTPGIALSPQQQESIIQEIESRGLLLDKAPEGYISLLALAKRLRVSRLTLDKVVGELEETGEVFPRYKFFAAIATAVSPEQQEKIASRPEFNIQRPPEGYKSSNALRTEMQTDPRSVHAAIEALEEEGETFSLFIFRNKIAVGLSPEQQQKIRSRPEFRISKVPEGYSSINGLARETGISEAYIRRMIRDMQKNGETFDTFKFHNKVGTGISPEQQAKITNTYHKVPPAPDDRYVSVNSLSKIHGISLPTIYRMVERLEEEGQEIKIHKIKGRDVRALSAEQYELFLQAPELKIEQAPEGYTSITAFAKKLGIEYKEFAAFIKQVKAEGEVFEIYRFGSSVVTDALSPEQQEKIANLPQFSGPPTAPEGFMTIKEFINEHGLNASKVSTAMRRLKKEGENFDIYRFGKKKVMGLSPDQVEKLLNLPLLTLPEPPKGVLSTFAFAAKLDVAPQTVTSRIEQLKEEGEEFSEYCFKTGITMGITQTQQQKIRKLLGK